MSPTSAVVRCELRSNYGNATTPGTHERVSHGDRSAEVVFFPQDGNDPDIVPTAFGTWLYGGFVVGTKLFGNAQSAERVAYCGEYGEEECITPSARRRFAVLAGCGD